MLGNLKDKRITMNYEFLLILTGFLGPKDESSETTVGSYTLRMVSENYRRIASEENRIRQFLNMH